MTKSTVPPVGLNRTTQISTRIPTRASHGNELQVAVPLDSVLTTKGQHGIATLEFLTFLY